MQMARLARSLRQVGRAGLWAIFLRCGPRAKGQCLRCADLSLLLCLLRFSLLVLREADFCRIIFV